jgi:hypothetical protein
MITGGNEYDYHHPINTTMRLTFAKFLVCVKLFVTSQWWYCANLFQDGQNKNKKSQIKIWLFLAGQFIDLVSNQINRDFHYSDRR